MPEVRIVDYSVHVEWGGFLPIQRRKPSSQTNLAASDVDFTKNHDNHVLLGIGSKARFVDTVSKAK